MSPPLKMITIEQVKEAQRTAPLAEETKAMQREYEAQLSAVRRSARAAEYREAREKEAARCRELTAQINSLSLCTHAQLAELGMKLVAISYRTAAWYGMAAKVAGGWIAVGLPLEHEYRTSYAALLPLSHDSGVPIAPVTVRKAWLESAMDNEELEDALAKLSDLTTEALLVS